MSLCYEIARGENIKESSTPFLMSLGWCFKWKFLERKMKNYEKDAKAKKKTFFDLYVKINGNPYIYTHTPVRSERKNTYLIFHIWERATIRHHLVNYRRQQLTIEKNSFTSQMPTQKERNNKSQTYGSTGTKWAGMLSVVIDTSFKA